MKSYLGQKVTQSLRTLGFDYSGEILFSKPKEEKFGDLSTNIALILAREKQSDPRQLAEQIIGQLSLEANLISKMEIAGGGFINFFFSPNYLYARLGDILAHPGSYGKHDFGKQRKVNVEFVSANPTGPLSIGHGRQAVLGDVLCRLFENAGWNVTREYYFNNAGEQMKRLGESIRLRYLELLGEAVEFPEKHYEGEYIKDIARVIKDEHGAAWRENSLEPFKAVGEEILFHNIKEVLRRMDLQFDTYFNEDALYKEGKIERLLHTLREKNLTYEKDGATWLKTSEFEYAHGAKAEADKVIVKSSGEPTYRLPDIAYHLTKFERGFDRIIDIFGADHIAEYPDVLAALKALGCDTSHVHVVIHQFVTLIKSGEILKMSKRKANFVTIDELLDTLGKDVFRYFLVMRSHHSHLNFDLELAIRQTMENPVFYVQNAHARICSIFSKAKTNGLDTAQILHADLALLQAPEEKDLIQKLLDFPELTQRLAEILEVHPLTTYLEELAALYHRYQTAGKKDEKLRVITQNRNLTLARLAVCHAVRIVIARGLHLLGVSAPEYMSRETEETEA